MKSFPETDRDATWKVLLREKLGLSQAHFPHLQHSSPRLSYGRHRGPAYPRARQAANLVLIHPDAAGQWSIPLMVRAETFGVHAGEIALPGGRCEAGETAQEAALREFHEETGHRVTPEAVVGELPPTNVWASNHLVRTFVAVELSLPTWIPDPIEVAALLHLPVSQLMDPRNFGMHQVTRRRVRFSAPHLSVDGQRVWGATLRMLVELGQALTSAE